MPPLLQYDPTGATFSPIPAEEYKKLVATLGTNSKVTKLVSSGDTGSCEVQGVDFAWAYYDATASLKVTITAKHGLFVAHVPNARSPKRTSNPR